MASVCPRPLALGVPAAAGALGALLWINGANEALLYGLNSLAETSAVLWSSVTATGDALFVLALFALFTARRPDVLWAGFLAALIATFASHLLKELIELPRPAAVLDRDTLQIIGPVLKKHAFPSGHTTAAFTFAAVVALCMARAWVTAAVIAAASAVALSRVVVGAHWPADVLAGAALGWLSGWAAVALARRWRWGLRRIPQAALGVFFLGCAVWLFDYDTGYPLGKPMQRAAAVVCVGVALWNGWRYRFRGSRTEG